MEKQTRNVITREIIEKELRFYNTADIRSNLVMIGVMALVCVPLIAMMVYISCEIFSSVWLEVVFSVLLGGLMGTPIWWNLFLLCRSLFDRRLLMRGDFEIVTRDLLYKQETTAHRHVRNKFHFSDFNDTEVGNLIFQLACAGDEFYIVHYKTKKEIQLLYSTKMYELK